MEEDLLALVPVRRGHFRLESGHHGDVWLDLDGLFLRPGRVRRFAAELARRLAGHGVETVCGPLVGGAFLAQTVAEEIGAAFVYAERVEAAGDDPASPVGYRLPGAALGAVPGRRVAVVDDAINAGSAVRATLAALRAAGSEPVAIGALLVLGTAAAGLAAAHGVPLERLASVPNEVWRPDACPLCAAGVSLGEPPGPIWGTGVGG